jgi:hypothetical protein
MAFIWILCVLWELCVFWQKHRGQTKCNYRKLNVIIKQDRIAVTQWGQGGTHWESGWEISSNIYGYKPLT